MLVSFSVENYRCFKDQVTLDLRVPRGTAHGATPWDGNLQSVVAIYGANASGKTGLVRAVHTMRQQVLGSYRASTIEADPFLFDSEGRQRPSRFSATFLADDGVCYAYGYGVVGGRVTEEWAERYTTARATRLFDRFGNEVRFSAALKGPNRAVQTTMRSSSLYLSAALAADHPGLAPLFNWFAASLAPYPPHPENHVLPDVLSRVARDPALGMRLIGYLGRGDVGVSGLEVHEMPKSARPGPGDVVVWDDAALGGETPFSVYRAVTTHSILGQEYLLPLDEESDGTLAMLCHAYILEGSVRHGATVVLDEVDASLHPLLVRQLIKVFLDPQTNPNQAQLVFTTHDTSVMDAGYLEGSVLARDEVWVTEKSLGGVSTLVPISARGARKRDNLAPYYLAGRYGGVPQPADLVDPVLV